MQLLFGEPQTGVRIKKNKKEELLVSTQHLVK
jgi:hypothetical protein